MSNKNKEIIKDIIVEAVIASIYIVLTLGLSFMSYGAIQIRISEILVLLCFFDKKHLRGVLLGCFVANLLGPLGIVDAVVGTFSTLLAGLLISKCKRLFTASLMPTLTSILVGLEISYLYHTPLFLAIGQVMVGEAISVSIIGVLIINLLIPTEMFKKICPKYENVNSNNPVLKIMPSEILKSIIWIFVIFGYPGVNIQPSNKTFFMTLFYPNNDIIVKTIIIFVIALSTLIIVLYLISSFFKKINKYLIIPRLIMISLVLIFVSILSFNKIEFDYEVYLFAFGCLLCIEINALIKHVK